VADSLGNVVNGVAWGPTVEMQWESNVTVEFHNVSVRSDDQSIRFDESTVLVIGTMYDLSPRLPVFYKPLKWKKQ
jgi:hypothetical protein